MAGTGQQDEECGIGVSLVVDSNGALRLDRMSEGGPAGSSGMVAPGDEVLAVDKKAVEGMEVDAVGRMLQGPPGSLVKIKVRRNNEHTYSVCLERGRDRPPPPPRLSGHRRELGEGEAESASSRICRGMERLNAGMAKGGSRAGCEQERLGPEELAAFRREQRKQQHRAERDSLRTFNAQRRQAAEAGVLRRECEDLERAGAPFQQVLEYQAWIRRLEGAEGCREREREMQRMERESEVEEMRERLAHLEAALAALLRADHTEEEARALSSKIRVVADSLSVLEEGGVGGGADAVGVRSEGVGGAGENRGGGPGVGGTAGVAKELGAMWEMNRGVAGEKAVATSGETIELAPEPCMLAKGTSNAIESLVKGVY